MAIFWWLRSHVEAWGSCFSQELLGDKISIFYRPSTSTNPCLQNIFLRWIEAKSTVVVNINEVDQYLTQSRLKKITTVISWWQNPAQKSLFPLLSLMAIDIFSISAMLSESKRVFSGTEISLSDNRASLTMITVKAMRCLKSWFRSGLFTKEEITQVMPAGIAVWNLLCYSFHWKQSLRREEFFFEGYIVRLFLTIFHVLRG